MKKQKRFMDFNQRLDNALANNKRKCKCGHTRVVPYSNKFDYIICDWCGSRLYFDIAKQKEYDKLVAKNEFMFKLNKCLNKAKNNKNENMRKKKMIDKRKLKRKYFNNSADYFTFCKDVTVQIYIVDTNSKQGKIVVYYGSKLGRPCKNEKKITPEEYDKRRRHYKPRYNH